MASAFGGQASRNPVRIMAIVHIETNQLSIDRASRAGADAFSSQPLQRLGAGPKMLSARHARERSEAVIRGFDCRRFAYEEQFSEVGNPPRNEFAIHEKICSSSEDGRKRFVPRCVVTHPCKAIPRHLQVVFAIPAQRRYRVVVSHVEENLNDETRHEAAMRPHLAIELQQEYLFVRIVVQVLEPRRPVVERDIDQTILGGFKWSSQHLDGSCDEHSKAALGSFWAGALVLTRSAAGGRARGAAAILGSDCSRHGE